MCDMDTDGFIVYIKIKTFTQILQKMFRQDLILAIMNQIDRPLPKGKNKKLIGLLKDALGGKIIYKIKRKNIQLFNRR